MKKSILWAIWLLFIIALGGGMWFFTQDKGDTEIQEEYYENWQLMYRAHIVNWVPNWEYVEYYENGDLKLKWEILDGKENWKWVDFDYEYFKWDLLVIETNWKEWKRLEGLVYWVNWVKPWDNFIYPDQLDDSKIRLKRIYENNDTYRLIEYYDDGEIRSTRNFVYWKEEWESIWYDENWNIAEKRNYKDWKKYWEQFVYYPSGEVFSKLIFDDNWDGNKYFYAKSWELLWTMEYKDYSMYSWTDFGFDLADNRVDSFRSYKNWKRDWEYIQYRRDWSISSKWNYKNWEQDWYQYSYDENWNIWNTALYKEWELIKEGIYSL